MDTIKLSLLKLIPGAKNITFYGGEVGFSGGSEVAARSLRILEGCRVVYNFNREGKASSSRRDIVVNRDVLIRALSENGLPLPTPPRRRPSSTPPVA